MNQFDKINELQDRLTRLTLQNELLREDNQRLATRKSHKVKYPQFVMFYVDGALKYGEIIEQRPGSVKVKVVYPYLAEETTVPEIFSLNWLVDKVSSLEANLAAAKFDIKLREQENMALYMQLREAEIELAPYKNKEAADAQVK